MSVRLKTSKGRLVTIIFALMTAGAACTPITATPVPPSPTVTPQEMITPTPEPTLTPVIPTSVPEGPWLLLHASDGLWSANPDGSGLVRLFEGDFWQGDLAGAVQPGGNKIALITSGEDRYHNLKLNLLSLPDGRLQQITALTTPATEPSPGAMPGEVSFEAVRAIVENPTFAWSPDGRLLAFIAVLDGPTSEVYLYDTTKNTINRVSRDDAQDYWPQWSQDGKTLLYFTAEAFGSGAGYDMQGVWRADADGSNGVLLYQPDSFGEKLFGWSDRVTAVLASWDPGCGFSRLRLLNIVSAHEAVLREECFTDAAAGSWSGVSSNPVVFGGEDGLFLLPAEGNRLLEMDERPVESIRWDPVGVTFIVKFTDGSLATVFPDGSNWLDAPAPVQDVSMYGLIWAWTNGDYGQPGVWISGPGMEIGQVFYGPAYSPLWDPHDNGLLFLSGSELGTDLYRAAFPSYSESVSVAQLEETVYDMVWIGQK